MSNILLLCAAILLVAVGGRATFAQSVEEMQQQTQTPPPIVVTSSDNGKPTDDLAGVVLDFGLLYLVVYTQGVYVQVSVDDGNGGIITTGSVTLRAGDKSFRATYAGPAPFFPNFQQINFPIPRDQFPANQTVYLRVCDHFGNCRNSTGATIRR